MDDQTPQPASASTSPAPGPAATSADSIAPATDLPRFDRFRANCRLAWPLRRSGHYPRRLLAQVIDSLVLLLLGAILFAGTDYAPIQRQGKLTTITVFPEIPVLRRIALTHQGLDEAAGQEPVPAGEAVPIRSAPAPSDTAAALDSAITSPAPADFTLYRHRTADGTEYAYTWYPDPGWYLYLLLFATYHTLLVGWCGQTVGKRAMGLRVVGKGGGRIGYLRALARAVVYLPGAYLYLGVFWIVVDRQRRGWHDLVAGTGVGEGR